MKSNNDSIDLALYFEDEKLWLLEVFMEGKE